ncbi:unnamed protein product [Zymoseptoria tritici ST99CH_1A5]|nr:unnamed protein product [Zymoseptoria tritici ST99CH_1A5]
MPTQPRQGTVTSLAEKDAAPSASPKRRLSRHMSACILNMLKDDSQDEEWHRCRKGKDRVTFATIRANPATIRANPTREYAKRDIASSAVPIVNGKPAAQLIGRPALSFVFLEAPVWLVVLKLVCH